VHNVGGALEVVDKKRKVGRFAHISHPPRLGNWRPCEFRFHGYVHVAREGRIIIILLLLLLLGVCGRRALVSMVNGRGAGTTRERRGPDGMW
jgi:hypothetical protein